MDIVTQFGFINACGGLILGVYFLRGFFRNTAKSVLSLILFPITILAYVILPFWLGKKVLVPSHCWGVAKLMIISFIAVTLIKWFLYFVLGSMLKDPLAGKNWIIKASARFPSAVLSMIEGAMICLCLFWIMDYGEMILENKFEDVYKEYYQHPLYQQVIELSPIYDIPGSKDFKVVMSVTTHPEFSPRLVESAHYQKIIELPSVHGLQMNPEFSKLIVEKAWLKIIFHETLSKVMKDEDFFALLIDEKMVQTCRRILPAYHQKLIDERHGQFEGLQLREADGPASPSKGEVAVGFQPSVEIRLKNGFTFQGHILHENFSEVTLQMEEGKLILKTNEIQSRTPLDS